jgi:hypothetical protein
MMFRWLGWRTDTVARGTNLKNGGTNLTSQSRMLNPIDKMPLPAKTSAEEARSKAGLIVGHWDILAPLPVLISDHDRDITAEEATKLWESDPNITWQCVRNEQKNQIIEDLNTQLGDEGILPVSPDVFKWP